MLLLLFGLGWSGWLGVRTKLVSGEFFRFHPCLRLRGRWWVWPNIFFAFPRNGGILPQLTLVGELALIGNDELWFFIAHNFSNGNALTVATSPPADIFVPGWANSRRIYPNAT